MAIGVVQLLEVVDVEHYEKTERRCLKDALTALSEGGPVEHIGQRILLVRLLQPVQAHHYAVSRNTHLQLH